MDAQVSFCLPGRSQVLLIVLCSKNPHRPAALSSRKRTSSLLSVSSSRSSKITLDLPKATASALVTAPTGKQDTFGAFIPTGSASESLMCIAHSSRTSLIGRTWPRSRRSPPHSIFPEDPELDMSSGPPSPTSSKSYIPSISRTSSSYSVSTPPTSPPTSILDFDVVSAIEKGKGNADLDPILAILEKSSRFCTRKVYCATCHKSGTSYPSCARCGEMWCSRNCRLVNGQRHVCSRTPKDNPSH